MQKKGTSCLKLQMLKINDVQIGVNSNKVIKDVERKSV
jgi:hypothetical protein